MRLSVRHRFAAFFTAIAIAIPHPVLAVDTPAANGTRLPANIKIPDVTLGEKGALTGQAVDAQGKPKVMYRIRVEQNGETVGDTATDTKGRFRLEKLRGGVCHVVTEDATFVCRCWTEETAPPAARSQLLVISQEGIERGQRPIGEAIGNPLLIGTVIAAAVAIPIAIHNSSSKRNGS
ncbi:MAG: hypothetical protein FJ295_11800 [Planctomycetes bacterium]|nr:hypothetical protein [Planctomycetota bacterium]